MPFLWTPLISQERVLMEKHSFVGNKTPLLKTTQDILPNSKIIFTHSIKKNTKSAIHLGEYKEERHLILPLTP